ncbi:MAG: EAL domain-containing protein [Dermatophilaceae bacterium]
MAKYAAMPRASTNGSGADVRGRRRVARRLGAKPRGRVPGLVTGLLGVLLLGASLISTVTTGRDAALADLDSKLSAHAASRASDLTEYFERAQSINLLLAHDSVFKLMAPGEGVLSGPQFATVSAQAGKAMAYLEQLYPGQISEACLIDSTGAELGRVVRGRVAPVSELSKGEADTPFFAPTLGLPQGHVYQAAPYVSSDTHEWVISNSTPMVNASGRPWALLHFELPLDGFRPGAEAASARSFSDLIVDNRSGQVLLDSARPLVESSLGRAGSPELRALVARPGASASGTVDGQRVAVARVTAGPDNANSWSVVVAMPSEALGWFSSIGFSSVAMALAALLLLAFAGYLRATHRAERQGEARYRTLIDQSSDLVLVVDRAGRADFLSPSVERLLAPPGKGLATGGKQRVNRGAVDLVAAVDPEGRAGLSAVLRTAAPGRMSAGEFSITSTEGTSTFEVSVQDLSSDPSVRGLVLTAHDVTDRLALKNEMEHRSLHDALTGLPNRAMLADDIEQALGVAERDGTSVGLLLLDLDRFKEVNDTFGHDYGDALLRQIGPRLAGVLGGVGTVARLGGDEFAVLLPGLRGVNQATDVAGALLSALAIPFPVEGIDVDVEASVGVVISGEHGQDATTLMQRADIAMYVAKTQHLAVFVYDASIDGHSASKLALVGDLRRALDSGELLLHYQPKVSLTSGEVLGVEALVRWQHPERGLVFPDEFIPLAENTGLMNRLTKYVLNAALAQARTWIDAGRPLSIAVNLSARDLHEERFAEVVAELLARHEVPAHLLELEVTETAIMTDPPRARAMLERLSALGIRLSLDDFGAGYTSLSQLTSLPIDEIKIDRSFVMTMAEDPSNALIVRSLVDLGHSLGLTLVAEGVETEGVLQVLAALGCDVAQGYHLSRAIPVAALDTWCADRLGSMTATR